MGVRLQAVDVIALVVVAGCLVMMGLGRATQTIDYVLLAIISFYFGSKARPNE